MSKSKDKNIKLEVKKKKNQRASDTKYCEVARVRPIEDSKDLETSSNPELRGLPQHVLKD